MIRRYFDQSRILILLSLLLAPAAWASPGPVRSIGPEGYVDRLADLRFPDPQDARHLLALMPHALWTSRDGGGSWREATATLPKIGYFDAVEVDPFDANHWLLLWLGAQSPTYSLAETRDAGATWTVLALPPDEYFNALRFDPQVEDLLLLATGIEILRSRDAGRTWEPVALPVGCCLHRVKLLGAQGSRWLVSIDDDLFSLAAAEGDWRKISDQQDEFLQLTPDRVRPEILYGLRQFGSLVKSTDGGRTFVEILQDGDGLRYFLQSPRNPGRLAVFGNGRLHLSTDGGATFTAEPLGPMYRPAAAFDPSNGDLLSAEGSGLLRRRPDGTRSAFRPRGFYGLDVADAFLDDQRGPAYLLSSGGSVFRRGSDARWNLVGQTSCVAPRRIALAPWNPSRVYVSCLGAYQVSEDGGVSFGQPLPIGGSEPNDAPRFLFGPGDPGQVFLLDFLVSLSTLEGPYAAVAKAADAVVHPDPDRGLLVSTFHPEEPPRGYLYRWSPPAAPVKLKDWSEEDPLQVLGQDPRNPDHLVAAGALNGGTSVSFDRGATWQERGTAPAYGPGIQALIDPNDGEHMVIGGGFAPVAESRDGARTWQYADRLRETSSIRFDASSNLYAAAADGLLMRSPQAEPCTDRDDNFCARQGRFEMTVEWKTSSGLTGTARKVATGSEESGLFYFFDRNNWELLVKVLDGCAINQRFWVFTAGTTDVDYLLKVEDRFTGRIRSYWNTPGQAAAAVGDIDAFATCGEPASASAQPAAPAAAAALAAAPAPLELLEGRFRVAADYTDFAGQQGFATPTPLRSANSGLFWFFSPDNWEVLIKVLDGCAINGHYWVLAAATTDVGYEIRVSEPAKDRERVYRNPVGRLAPAQIDLQAFACGG